MSVKKKCQIKLSSLMLVVLLIPAAAAASECAQKGVTNKSTAVYALPPNYVTGKGWQGDFVRTLQEGTQLYICECQDVEFGFSTKSWCRAALRAGEQWEYGWILRDDLNNWPNSSKREEASHAIFYIVHEAIAATGDMSPAEEWTLSPPPPGASSSSSTQNVPSTNSLLRGPAQATGSTFSFSESLRLYWPLFTSMILGMGAKAGVDLLYAGNKKLALEHLRSAVVSILISPIVFLGFLNGGSFQASAQTFVVLCLVAFQNGFFWQTILKRPVGEGKASVLVS